jgi:glycogen debranching enzyme
MRFADGSLAAPPIAAVEVQGYIVSARRGMAEVYEALHRPREAGAQRSAAAHLAATIDERFWMPDEGTYALGLDATGRQIDAVASNAGHLLWTDAIPPERAASVAERLLEPDMFTGWGIRTLSSRNPGYNPIGYHTGSVWPHDTSLVANGLARAGQHGAAQRVIDGLLDAAEASDGRLPELFAGFDREATPDLVPYPTACSPQAWATGAIFLSVRTLLGIPVAQRAPQWQDLSVIGAEVGTWRMAELSVEA